MITKLPQNTKQIVVSNGLNAIQGLLAYTKNIDLDEKGVIKLAPPMLKIFSNEVAEGGDVNLDLPIDIFSWDEGSFKVITDDRAFNFLIATMSFSEDSGYTGWISSSRIVNWVGGLWHIGGGDVYSFTAATANSVYTSVIGAALKFIELFVNRNTLVGNVADNILRQYDTSYVAGQALTLPENFVITGNAYSNNMMGIATRQSKNQGNAYFFTWDGATAAANAGYPVNDAYILDVKAYKSSWVLFTSAGQLLYFNGGGFTELGSIPTFRFEDDLISMGPNNSINIGNIMDVDGDVIYINIASLPEFSSNNKPHRPGFAGGMYCYDPEVGLYHRGSPSYSKYAPEDCSVSSDIVTSAAHYLKTGDEVWLKATDLGLTGERTYFAIVIDSNTFKLADTYAAALANTSLTITNGTLNNLFWVKRKDYGQEAVRITDLGLVKKSRNYEGFNLSGIMSTFLGGKVYPNDVTGTRANVLCAAVPIMSNIGRAITSKFQTDGFTDNWKGIAIKYRKLSPQSSIVVKAKVQDRDPIVIGDMTMFSNSAYAGPSVTWDASGDYFETTFDLSEVEAGDEVRVYAGAGAGQSAHISSIEQGGGVWQVTLDEVLRGITSNAKSCVSIEKYEKLGSITADDTDGVKYFTLAKPSPTLEAEVELRGIGVTISEILPVSSKHTSEV